MLRPIRISILLSGVLVIVSCLLIASLTVSENRVRGFHAILIQARHEAFDLGAQAQKDTSNDKTITKYWASDKIILTLNEGEPVDVQWGSCGTSPTMRINVSNISEKGATIVSGEPIVMTNESSTGDSKNGFTLISTHGYYSSTLKPNATFEWRVDCGSPTESEAVSQSLKYHAGDVVAGMTLSATPTRFAIFKGKKTIEGRMTLGMEEDGYTAGLYCFWPTDKSKSALPYIEPNQITGNGYSGPDWFCFSNQDEAKKLIRSANSEQDYFNAQITIDEIVYDSMPSEVWTKANLTGVKVIK